MKLVNGSVMPVSQVLGGSAVDSNDKPLKFEQEKDVSVPSFKAKGSDGQMYGFTIDTANVRVAVAPEPDLKEMRRRGDPIPKEDAKRIDAELKREQEEAEKAKNATTGTAPPTAVKQEDNTNRVGRPRS